MEAQPLSGPGQPETPSYSQKGTVYEKLGLLCAEIESDIRSSSHSLHPELLKKTLEQLREQAFLDRSPEAQHALLLYRKQKEILQQQRSATASAPSDYTAPLTTIINKYAPKIPDYVLEAHEEIILGHETAVRKNIFWLRFACWLFSLLSFSVMSSAPFIHYATPTANDLFSSSCPLRSSHITGSFDFSCFQAAIAAAVFVFVHSTLFLAYYILPINAQGHKHVPYLAKFFEPCMVDRAEVDTRSAHVASFCRLKSKLIECVVDAGLVGFTAVVVVIAAIVIERGTRFDFGGGVVTWFSLGTFWLSFSESSPPCVSAANPAGYIRAALSMLFFALFFQILALVVSTKSYLKEMHVRGGGLSPLASSSSSAAGDYGGAKRSLIAHADPDNDDVVEVSL